jgi:tetratricopeptide (TPR) repeat protein
MTDDDDPHPGAHVLPFVRPARGGARPAAPVEPTPPPDDDPEADGAWLLAKLEAQGLDEAIEDAQQAILRGDPSACDRLPALRNARALRNAIRGDGDAALAEWQALIDEDPRQDDALALRQIYRERTGDFEGAIEDLSALIGLSPNDVERYRQRGLLFIHTKDHARARADFERAAHLAPNDHASYAWLGRSQSLAGDHAAAIRAFGRAIKLAPWSAELYEERATEYFHAGAPEAAMQDLTHCLAIDPKCAVAYRKRAVLHPWPEDADAWVADLDAALALEPDDRFTLRARAACHSHRGDAVREEADLTRAIDLLLREPAGAYDAAADAEHHAARAHARMRLGLYGAAVDDFTHVIRLQRGTDAAMFLLRAKARRKEGDLHAAALDDMAASRIGG